MTTQFSLDILKIDAEGEVARITSWLRQLMRDTIRRRGIVVALSGGIDSSVTCALAVKAIGAERVYGLHMPEKDSAPETLALSRSVSDCFGIDSVHEDITEILESVGFYRRYQAAVKKVIPDYALGWKSKIVIPSLLESNEFSLFSVVALSPAGESHKVRLPLQAYLEILAATNFKQRVRKMLEYYHADRLNYAVAGTPNRLEYDQGFFVKLGDGAADLKPIAHLYKTQVYQMAEYLGVPEQIRHRPPTTDTYSLPQGQDEFYFSLPYEQMDICLYGKNQGVSPGKVADLLGLQREQIDRVYADIDNKRRSTRYLHLPAQLVEGITELQ